MIAISSFASKGRRLLVSSAALLALASNAMGQPCRPPGEETVIAAFGSGDGAPIGGVTFGPDGGLYVQTFAAHGSLGSGAVYKLTPPPPDSSYWRITLAYGVCIGQYCAGAPGGPLILDTSGALYGVSTAGGVVGCPGVGQGLCGFIFRLGPTGSVYDFHGPADGYSPSGGLVLGADGSVYGTTREGGAHGAGTAFRLTPGPNAWTKTTIYDFLGVEGDGANPRAGLIVDSSGALYGTTTFGGAAGKGAVFKLTPPATPSGVWTESVLYSFTGLSDGAYPTTGLTFATRGALYGTNTGVVFMLTPPVPPATAWTPTILHSFSGGEDGGSPVGSLVVDTNGALYGATLEGGVRVGGRVFKLTPPVEPLMQWRLTTLYSFSGGQDGRTPSGGVILDNAGGLYGTTKAGGPYGGGVVFRINNSPPGCL
jgi:uncharacterized repeat protein (TIGR03803 family)